MCVCVCVCVFRDQTVPHSCWSTLHCRASCQRIAQHLTRKNDRERERDGGREREREGGRERRRERWGVIREEGQILYGRVRGRKTEWWTCSAVESETDGQREVAETNTHTHTPNLTFSHKTQTHTHRQAGRQRSRPDI